MIDFYTYPTPNTWKVGIMLEECGLPDEVHLVDIAMGERPAVAAARLIATDTFDDDRRAVLVGPFYQGEVGAGAAASLVKDG